MPTRRRDVRAGSPGACASARLPFGDRVLCPFLRPFFLDAADEPRVTRVAETLWPLGRARRRGRRSARPRSCRQLALSDDEIRLARIDPGYATTSTAARADAFILPDSLQFAEYNGESPAGAGYSQGLAELFAEEPLMERFRERFDVRMYPPIEALLDALLASYREWGGTASPPRIAIVDWREVPTWSEFEILRDAFVALGVPTVVCDPRDLDFDGRRAAALQRGRLYCTASASIWSTAACSSTTSSRAKTSAARCSTPTRRAPSASPTPSAARSRTRRRSSPC